MASDWRRSQALAELAPYLPEALLEEVLGDLACDDGAGWSRFEALNRLPPLAELPFPAPHRLWCETLHSLAGRTQNHLITDLRALAPVVNALGGTEAIVEVFHAIQDVGHWWP